jgi:hypothetical protein
MATKSLRPQEGASDRISFNVGLLGHELQRSGIVQGNVP